MPISFVIPYYNNSHHLGRQLELWTGYPAEIRDRVQFVVVDDGSPTPLTLDATPPLNLSIYRILEDVGWNNGGARNLGVHVAKTPWVFLCDIDHFVSADVCAEMLALELSDPQVFYTFSSARDGRPQFSPPNIFLVARQPFLDLGGYDEDLSGHYGGEDYLLRTLMHYQLRQVDTPLVLDAPDETVYDPPARRGDRTHLEINDEVIQKKLATGEYHATPSLRFPWKQTAEFTFSANQFAAQPAALPPASRHGAADEHRCYREACRQIDRGLYDDARRQLTRLLDTSSDAKLRALGLNDLGALDVVAGDLETGRHRFQASLELDPSCSSAATNLRTLDAKDAKTGNGQLQVTKPRADDGAPEPVHAQERLRIVVLSFLFNWPSSGGGIMHTVGLIQALMREGHEVTHLFARKLDVGIGQCDDTCPIVSTVLEFDDATWKADVIQRRFREAVDAAAPDVVLITDSWNFKPLLAEAVREHRYILRFDALECLCPLNNIRLLPADGGFRQCHRHQLATPGECRTCVDEWSKYSGVLHNLERDVSQFADSAYHPRLLRALREAWAVLAVNPSIATLLEPYADRVLSVPSGIDAARFPAGIKPSKDSQVATVLFAGSAHDPIKGFDVLHEGCARLWKRRQDFELLVTGDPPGRHDEFTWLLGWQSQQEIVQHFRAADVVVIPSVCQEAMPLVAMEAMGASCAVIASRLGGLPFSIVDGATGLLFEPGDANDLALQIETLLDDPRRRRQMGEAGRRRFEAFFTWDAVVRRHYRPLLQEISQHVG